MQLFKLFFAVVVLSLRVSASAQTGNPQRDNLLQVESRFENGKYRVLSSSSYKLPKHTFIELYAFNDTARAIVNLYFERHAHSRIIFGTALGILTMIRVAGPVQSETIGPPPATTTYHPWVYPALGVAGVTTIAGVLYQESYNRKSLLEKLIEYEGAKRLDKRTLRKLRARHFQE
jgi:hypothetical protein